MDIRRDQQAVTYLFHQIRKVHHQLFQTLLREQDLFPGQHIVLFALEQQDGLNQKEIASLLACKSSTATVMLRRMEKVGHIERRPDPKDQRATRVFATEKGRSAGRDAREALRRIEAKCTEDFTADEKAQLCRFLLRAQANLKSAVEAWT